MKTSKREKTIQNILNKTSLLLTPENINVLKYSDIARILKVNLRTLYNYYPNKESLIEAVMQFNLNNLLTRIRSTVTEENYDFANIVEDLITISFDELYERGPFIYGSLEVIHKEVNLIVAPLIELGHSANIIKSSMTGETLTLILVLILKGLFSASDGTTISKKKAKDNFRKALTFLLPSVLTEQGLIIFKINKL